MKDRRRSGPVAAGIVAALALVASACQGAAPGASAPPSSPAAQASAPTAGAGGATAPTVGGAAASPAAASAASPAAASAPTTEAAPAGPPLKVQVVTARLAAEAPTFVALDRGYFREAGLDVDLVPLATTSDMIPALATDQVQFASIGPGDPSIFNAVLRGIPLKIVAPNNVIAAGNRSSGLVVRADLVDSGRYGSPTDLQGLNVAYGGIGTRYNVGLILAGVGLSENDVAFTQLGFADTVTALANRAVDASYLVEPFITLGGARGVTRLVVPVGDLLPGALVNAVMVSPAFLQAQPAAVRQFVAAHLRGARDYYRAIQQDAGGRDDMIRILTEYTPITDPQAYATIGLPSVEPNGQMTDGYLASLQDYFVRAGTQPQPVDLGQVIDRSYVNDALARLGRVP